MGAPPFPRFLSKASSQRQVVTVRGFTWFFPPVWQHRAKSWAIAPLQVMLMASMVPTTINAKQGFGRHVYAIDPQILPSIGLNAALASLFSILASVWSKTSFAITLLRLVGKWTKVLLWFIIVSINIAMILLAILYWVQCTPPDKLWNVMKPGSCWDPNIYSNYGIFASAYSGAMDIVLALLPWRVVWSLQMKKKEKFGIAVAMSMGLLYVSRHDLEEIFLVSLGAPLADFSFLASAGVTAMIKTAKIPSLATGDFTCMSFQHRVIELFGPFDSVCAQGN